MLSDHSHAYLRLAAAFRGAFTYDTIQLYCQAKSEICLALQQVHSHLQNFITWTKDRQDFHSHAHTHTHTLIK